MYVVRILPGFKPLSGYWIYLYKKGQVPLTPEEELEADNRNREKINKAAARRALENWSEDDTDEESELEDTEFIERSKVRMQFPAIKGAICTYLMMVAFLFSPQIMGSIGLNDFTRYDFCSTSDDKIDTFILQMQQMTLFDQALSQTIELEGCVPCINSMPYTKPCLVPCERAGGHCLDFVSLATRAPGAGWGVRRSQRNRLDRHRRCGQRPSKSADRCTCTSPWWCVMRPPQQGTATGWTRSGRTRTPGRGFPAARRRTSTRAAAPAAWFRTASRSQALGTLITCRLPPAT